MIRFRSLVLFLLTLLFALPAAAQSASFGRFHDATPGRYFALDAAVDDGTGTLQIPIGSGVDENYQDRAFIATTASGLPGCYFCWALHQPVVQDTITLLVVAPDGYQIDTITYVQEGSRSTSRGDKTFSASTMVVNGVPSPAVLQTPATSALAASEVGTNSAEVVVTTTLAASPGAASVIAARLVVTLVPVE